MKLRAGLAALVGAFVAAAIVVRVLHGGGGLPPGQCPAGGCSTIPFQLACHQLGTRDLNPHDHPVPPQLGRPLLPRRPDGRVQMGFNDSAYQAGQATLPEDIALQRGAGSTLWRLPLDWSLAEPTPGQFNFGYTDSIYCAALAAGIKPIFVVSDPPDWAADEGRPCPDTCEAPPAAEHDADLERFAEATAIRYRTPPRSRPGTSRTCTSTGPAPPPTTT